MQLFDLEMKWRKNQRMPLAFEPHEQLFPEPSDEKGKEEASSSLVLSYLPKCFSGELFRASAKL